LALLWLPLSSWGARRSWQTSGPGCGSGDRLRGAGAEHGRDPGGLVLRAGRLPGEEGDRDIRARSRPAAGRDPGAQGPGSRYSGALQTGKRCLFWGGRCRTHWPLRRFPRGYRKANCTFWRKPTGPGGREATHPSRGSAPWPQ